MKYPNVKPQQGEQKDINQRRYPSDTIELAGPQDQKRAENHTAANNPNEGGAARPSGKSDK